MRGLKNREIMTQDTENAVKKAIVLLNEAIDVLQRVKGENDEVDEVCDELGYKIADLEFELNS
jgi:hypothetical protein